MTNMLTVAPSGLGRFTWCSPLRFKQSFRRGQAFSSSVRTTCSSSGVRSSSDSWGLVQDASKQLRTEAERLVQNTKESEVRSTLAPIAASAALCIQVAGPALAEVVPVEVVDDSSYWLSVLLTSGAFGFVYLLVIPVIIYNYLRLRWYKRSALETYFQFMLVFLFFPGLLLLAPFINFRRLPREGAEPP